MSVTTAEKLANAYLQHMEWTDNLDEESIDDILLELKELMEHDLKEERARRYEDRPTHGDRVSSYIWRPR